MAFPLPGELVSMLDEAARGQGLILALTGAGISAESGIPTFRGQEGYWTVGSQVYYPQELATRAAFARMPAEVWRWYLHRLGICWRAAPNAAHHALVGLEDALGDRFLLITQNVDGLHLRAGNSAARTFPIHGNINFVRCAGDCDPEIRQIPDSVRDRWAPPQQSLPELSAADRQALTCRRCGQWLRPHVLWFDEYYDEKHYRFESSLAGADRADLLLVVGTSGATNLPNQVAERAARRGAAIVLVDPESSPFAAMADRRGFWARGPAGQWLPGIAERLAAPHSRARPGS